MKIFTGGGLIGWLAKAREEKIMDEYRKACAREWVDSFNRPRSFGGGVAWLGMSVLWKKIEIL